MTDSSQTSQTVQYTTQYSDLYGSAEALQLKIKGLGFAIQGLELSIAHEDGEWIKGAFEEMIADLERHAISIKYAVCDLKIGGTLL